MVLLEFIISVEVYGDSDVDGQDGQDDAGESDGCKLVDKLDPDKHDGAHDHQQARPIHSEVVVHDVYVLCEVPEY